jgi:serine phosphatase RsbU (regulator of sigma subunit)
MAKLRVLIVDDEESILDVLGVFFRRRGDDYHTVSSGAEALEILREKDFDVLLSDMAMPVLNGLELIQHAREIRQQMVCILMSGVGSRGDIIAAMKIGVFDFVDKPFPDFMSLSAMVDRAGEQSRLIRERDELLDHLRQQNAKLEVSLNQLHEAYGRLRRQEKTLESDLRQAQRVQRRLLPQGFPRLDGLDLHGYFRPCERLGGDFFGTIPLGGDRLAVYLVDVAGHGVSAAMITVILRELIHARRMLDSRTEIFISPAETLAFLNQGLLEEAFDPPILVTMTYCVLDALSGRVVCACAGHPPPVLVSGLDQGRLLPVGGPVLGMDLPGKYETAEVTLNPGDFLLLYSDGFPEARDSEGREFTEQGLCRAAARAHGRCAAEVVSHLDKELSLCLSGRSPVDDVTFLVIGRPLDAQRHERSTHASMPGNRRQEVVPDSIRVAFPKAVRNAQPARRGEVTAGWAENAAFVIRLTGLATWQCAPALRDLFEKAREAVAPIHVDLSSCEGMDSTILGLLYQRAAEVLLHQPGSRPMAQLGEMGILGAFRVTDAPAPGIEREICITPSAPQETAPTLILAAHESLMEVSETNRKRFGDLVQSLRKGESEKAARTSLTKRPPTGA